MTDKDSYKSAKESVARRNSDMEIMNLNRSNEWECPKCGYRVVSGHKPHCFGSWEEFHEPVEMVPWEDPKKGYE